MCVCFFFCSFVLLLNKWKTLNELKEEKQLMAGCAFLCIFFFFSSCIFRHLTVSVVVVVLVLKQKIATMTPAEQREKKWQESENAKRKHLFKILKLQAINKEPRKKYKNGMQNRQ